MSITKKFWCSLIVIILIGSLVNCKQPRIWPDCECASPCLIINCKCPDCPGTEPGSSDCECANPCLIINCECPDCPGTEPGSGDCECDNPCLIINCECTDCPGTEPGSSDCECDNPCLIINCECTDCPGTEPGSSDCECDAPCLIEDCNCPDCPNIPVITISTQPVSPNAFIFGAVSGSLTVAADVTHNATPGYQWYSNSTNSSSGGSLLTGKTDTSFTIPVSLEAGTHYYYCVVSATGGAVSVTSGVAAVTVNPAPITSVSITVTAPALGETPAAAATGTGNFTVGSVSWAPNDSTFKPDTPYTAVVTLTANTNYTFTGLTANNAKINDNSATIGSNDGTELTLSYTFDNIAQPGAGVTLDKTEVTMVVGGPTQQLTATVTPNNAANKNVNWLSSNNAAATVSSNGTVTAVGAGTTTITVTTVDGNHTAQCIVTVQLNFGLTITISATDNAPVITGGTIYRPNSDNKPTTALITFDNPQLYSNIFWYISGTGITGTGPVFFINTAYSAFNKANDYFITVEAVKGGIPYSRTVIFTVAE